MRSQGTSPTRTRRTPSSRARSCSRRRSGPSPAITTTSRGSAAAAARRSVSSPFSGASRATESTATSSGSTARAHRAARGAARQSVGALHPGRTSIVFAKRRTRSGRAPFATSDARESAPSANAPQAPRTTRGTIGARTARRHCAPRHRVVGLERAGGTGDRRRRRPRDRRLRRERTPAGDDDDLRLGSRRAPPDPGRDRVLVPQQPCGRPGRERRAGRPHDAPARTCHVRPATV